MGEKEKTAGPAIAAHGASRLPAVEVDSYNVELKDDEGFIGDRASKGAFRDILENWRKPLRKTGDDPFGDEPTRRDHQEEARRAAGQGRSRGRRRRAGRDRGVRAGAGAGHPPLPQDSKAGGTPSASSSAAASARAGSANWSIGRAGVHPEGRRDRHRSGADPQRSGRSRADRRGASRADLDVQGARRHPRRRHRRHQHPRRRGRAQPEEGARICQRRRCGNSSSGGTPTRRRSAATRPSSELVEMLEKLIDKAEKEGLQARAVHRHRLSRASSRRTARSTAARRTCPATGRAAVSTCRRDCARRSRKIGDHETAIADAQRRRRAGPERGAVHEGRRALGRADHRHRARQRALHQPASRRLSRGLRARTHLK